LSFKKLALSGVFLGTILGFEAIKLSINSNFFAFSSLSALFPILESETGFSNVSEDLSIGFTAVNCNHSEKL